MIGSSSLKSAALLTRNLTKAAAANTRNTHHGIEHLKTLAVSSPKPFVFHVELNRPNKLNALNKQMWTEIKECFDSLSVNPDCRAIVLSAQGKHFTAGIDLADMMALGQQLSEVDDVARKGVIMERMIKLYQDCISSLEVCSKPVISAIHSACIGAGVNLITAADIRYCTQDAWFTVKEVQIGMAADVGALQRFPKVVSNQSAARELCFTGRKFLSDEAKDIGLVTKVFGDKDSLLTAAIELAETIAQLSPIAVQATKQNMVYSLDHTNQEGLDHIRAINKMNLLSEDLANAVTAQLTKAEKPTFAKL